MQLKGFEIVKGVHLEGEEFSVDKDLITPSFKKKRPQLLKHYKVGRSIFSDVSAQSWVPCNVGSTSTASPRHFLIPFVLIPFVQIWPSRHCKSYLEEVC